MTANASPAPTVFRTTPRSRRVMLIAYLPLALLTISIAVLAAFVPAVAPFAIAFGLLALGAVAYAVAFAIRSRVEFGGGGYRQVFALTESAFTADDVEKVFPVDSLDYGLQSAPHLFVVGKTRRRLMQLNDQMLERSQLEALTADFVSRGALVEHVTQRLTIRQFATRHPGVLPWQLAHRGRFLALVALVTLVVLGSATVWTVVNLVATFSP